MPGLAPSLSLFFLSISIVLSFLVDNELKAIQIARIEVDS